MATTAQTIIDRAQIILQDASAVRWTEAELLGWVNDGQREIVLLKPDANATAADMQCVAGTRQTIPSNGAILIDVIRNQDGQAITQVERREMDSFNPDWHTDAAKAVVKNFIFDDRDQKGFYVYPQSNGTNSVTILYSVIPTNTVASGNIALDDMYANALLDYTLYRAFSKEAEHTADTGRASLHMQAFLGSLNTKDQGELAVNP